MKSRNELEQIIDREEGDAKDGCPRAQSLVINALADHDDLDMFELMVRRNQQSEEEQA